MKIIHTYINNMGIDPNNPNNDSFADKWGLTSLQKLGHEVILICGSNNNQRKEYIWKGIKIIELPPLFQITTSSRILNGFIKELKNIKADVFHTHHYCSFIPEITVMIGKLRNIPTYITFHTTFTGRGGLAGLFERIYLVLMQPFLPSYTKSCFISNYLKNKKCFFLIPKIKRILLYNQFHKPIQFNIKRKENSILFIGRITYLKGLDIIFKALPLVKKEVPNFKLRIIGKAEENYKKELDELAIKYGLTKNITYLGPLYDKRKTKEIYSNTILIMPSRDEGFGNVAMEGLIHQIPVLVSNKASLPEVVNYNEDLIFKNTRDLANKIIFLLKNKKARNLIIKKTKNHTQRFIEDNIGKKLIGIYQND